MIELGLEDVWIKKLGEIKPDVIRRRREKLLEQFPNAIFTDLTGEKYYGEDVHKFLSVKTSGQVTYH
jgi:ribosomal protein S17E